MNVQMLKFASLGKEQTLRQDFDFHFYINQEASDCYRFKDLFEINIPNKISVDTLDDFLYCEIGDTDKNGDIYPVPLNFSNRNLLDENYYKKIEKGDIISVNDGDILLSKVRPNLKKYIRITAKNKNVYFTSAFISIRAKIIPEIFYYCFRSIFFKKLMAISRQGKGYPTLKENDLQLLKFEKNIIDTLIAHKNELLNQIAEIEKRIENSQKKQIKHQSIIDTIFQREFGFDYQQFEEQQQIKNWHCHSVGLANNPDLRFSAKFHRPAGAFVMEQLTSLTNKKIKNFLAEPIVLGASIAPEDYDENGEAYYVSMATIKTWQFVADGANIVSNDFFNNNSQKTVAKDDIIFARSGEGTIGKVAIIEEEVDGIFADFTMRIRLKDYNAKFAYYYFRTSYFQYLVEIYKKGFGNNTNIFPIVLQEFPMLDIPLEEQQRIVDEINVEIGKQDAIKEKIAELRSKIDKIIEDTIRGE